MSHTVSPQEADCLWGFLCSWGAVTEGAETQAAARCAVRLCRANGEMGGGCSPKRSPVQQRCCHSVYWLPG